MKDPSLVRHLLTCTCASYVRIGCILGLLTRNMDIDLLSYVWRMSKKHGSDKELRNFRISFHGVYVSSNEAIFYRFQEAKYLVDD